MAGILGRWVQPAHTITLLPTVLLVNLLPIDLFFACNEGSSQVSAGSESAITFVHKIILN